ncbi:MAG: hypothetical protein U9N84_15085 [Actinomycetota bacterium]|nr:hypothetical protein [Actinomycetota bacterium]
MIIAVFFPSLMGVGILISGALLISDWLRRLLPHGRLRRKHNVIVGTYGAIADSVEAAGYHLEEPWFLRRGLRNRLSYIGVAMLLALLGAGSMWAGREFYADPLGLFFRSPWATGIGYGVGAALLIAAALCLVIGLAYRSIPEFMTPLIADTSLGRFVLPTEEDHHAALHNLDKEP